MSNEPILIDPNAMWLSKVIEEKHKQLANPRYRSRVPTPQGLQGKVATCRTERRISGKKIWRCGRQRRFPGPLAGVIAPRLPPLPGSDPKYPVGHSRLILHEFPKAEFGPSWSHSNILHPDLSAEVGSRQYAWESQCDQCESSEVVPEVFNLQIESVQRIQNGGHTIFDPQYCRDCHTRREGASISGTIGFQGEDALPMASIIWFEIDPERDFGEEFGKPTRRWVYFGDVEMPNYKAGKYLWSALCPDCFNKHWRGLQAARHAPLIVPAR